jgi:uncharacterized membrane protein YkvA (DUF1232 family)
VSKFTPRSDLKESAGFVGGLINQARLGWRLLRDNRVPSWVKAIPFAALLYFLSPIDLIPDMMLPGLGEVDDVVIMLLALKVFVDLSPPGIVREHLNDLLGRRSAPAPAEEPTSATYIDAPYRVLDPNEE